MLTITSAGITDIGRKRKGNEDSLLIDDELKLYLVADGMGGHQAGEVASRIVVESIRNDMKQYQSENDVTAAVDFETTRAAAADRLLAAICKANEDVHRMAEHHESYKGMGSTVSAIYFVADTLVAANVGDSPIYLLRRGKIETISTPHTVLDEHAAIAPKGTKPLGPQYRHMLTRAMGIDQTVDPAVCAHEVLDKDILVISSDGLSDKVAPEEVLQITKRAAPNVACRSLVDLANERGGEDNITVIVLNIDSSTKQSADDAAAEGEIKGAASAVDKKRLSVEFDTEDGSYRRVVKNLSVDGLFIETGESFSVGQHIFLTFSMDDSPASVMIKGEVVQRLPRGISVAFVNLTQDQRHWIESIQNQI
jgi:protein phosphatase